MPMVGFERDKCTYARVCVCVLTSDGVMPVAVSEKDTYEIR